MRRKINGSRSKKCTLPSDRLTPAQKRRLNGPVTTYDLSKPMRWIEFIEMPQELQLEYLEKLKTEHYGRRRDIAEMFGIDPGVLTRYVKDKLGQTEFFPLSAPKIVQPEWLAFESSKTPSYEPDDDPFAEPDEVPIVQPAKDTGVKQASAAAPIELHCTSGKLRYSGDPHMVFAKALNALDLSRNYSFCIIFQEVGGGQA